MHGNGLRLHRELILYVCGSLSTHRETCLSWPCPSPPFLHYYWWCPLPVCTLPWRCSHSRKTLPPCYSSQIKIIAPCHVGRGNWLLSLPFFLLTKSLLFSDLDLKGPVVLCVVFLACLSPEIYCGVVTACLSDPRSETLTGNKRDRGDRPVNSFFSRGPWPRKHCVTSCRKDPGR